MADCDISHQVMIKRFLRQMSSFIVLMLGLSSTQATVYPLPDDDLIGHLQIIQSNQGDTAYKIARRFEMGFDELLHANAKLPKNSKIKSHQPITIPSFFILPNAPYQGIVINLPEMRLYYYPLDRSEVVTEPIAIGRLDWETPETTSYVVERIKDPLWMVPEKIKERALEKGKTLPHMMLPGPDNPLGQYALRLGMWTILIHGTNDPSSIGRRISSGCIRLYPEDIAHLYTIVKKHTPVYIINQPYKIGWYKNHLYLEPHKPLKENRGTFAEEYQKLHDMIMQMLSTHPVAIYWKTIKKELKKYRGIPFQIDAVG